MVPETQHHFLGLLCKQDATHPDTQRAAFTPPSPLPPAGSARRILAFPMSTKTLLSQKKKKICLCAGKNQI